MISKTTSPLSIQTTTLQVQRKLNTQITITNLFTFIEISQKQKHSISKALIRLFSLRYKQTRYKPYDIDKAIQKEFSQSCRKTRCV